MMERFRLVRPSNFVFLLLALLVFAGCKKKSQSAAGASPSPGLQLAPAAGATPAITGPVAPAVVNQGSDSITRYLHYPKDPVNSKLESAVQFYCDIGANGAVEATYALVGDNETFKAAVQTALDWGHFTPATASGNPVPAYIAGTVLFFHENSEPVIVVSLATYDRARVAKLTNYVQPQMLGGLRRTLEKIISTMAKGVLVSGRAGLDVKVDANGVITETSNPTETPVRSGLSSLLQQAVRSARFTPAYDNGQPAAGGINLVADFTQL